MKKITSVEELIEILENSSENFGLRGASEHDIEIANRGYLDCSLDTWDERDCPYDEDADKLSGTSAIYVSSDLDAEELAKRYQTAYNYAKYHHCTEVVYLVSDSSYDWGDDDNEIVLGHNGYGADVVAVVEL